MAGGWKLFWSDEFDSTALSEQNWTVQTANPGAVNGELQRYTAGHDKAGSNIFVTNGSLILETRKASEITSGKIVSNLKNFTYGRMEARMRLPTGKGMWPAFWMLGANINSVGWPACGEVDIMEERGRLPNWTSASYHFSGYDTSSWYMLPTGDFHQAFHIFAYEWYADSMRWCCDNVNMPTLTRVAHPNFPWDKPFFFILNLAVGGNFDVNIDSTTIFPESLLVDYVRVFHWDPSISSVTAGVHRTAPAASITNLGSRISLEFPAEQAFTAKVAAINGKTVLLREGFGRTATIPTGSLAPGVYFVNVRGTLWQGRDRFVVRR
jgi:beta-glucanase (GH16 family)